MWRPKFDSTGSVHIQKYVLVNMVRNMGLDESDSTSWPLRQDSSRDESYLVSHKISGFLCSSYFFKMAKLGPGVYNASNRNEYKKHKNNNVSAE
jgi:hypothetical protein